MKRLSSLTTVILAAAALGAIAADDAVQAPEGMQFVPSGAFIMGSDVGDADESPKHLDNTEAYFIDKFEVSNAAFKAFDPAYTYEAGRDDYPVVVTWERAAAYAKWAGKRLPTEKEWEKAARGTDGRTFPWGESHDLTFYNWDEADAPGTSPAHPESPYGCVDMAGGVWEWTSDWYQPYPGNEVPCAAYGETYKVLRGGGTFNDVAMMRTTHRYYLPLDTTAGYRVGFRCVKDVQR